MIRPRLPALVERRRVRGIETVGAAGLAGRKAEEEEKPDLEMLYGIIPVAWVTDEETGDKLPMILLDEEGMPVQGAGELYDAVPGFEIPCSVIPPQAWANDEPVSRGNPSFTLIDLATGRLMPAAGHVVKWKRTTITGPHFLSELYPDTPPEDDRQVAFLPPGSLPSSWATVSEDETPYPVFVAACGVCDPYPDGWLANGGDEGPQPAYFWVTATVDGAPARPAVFLVGLSG